LQAHLDGELSEADSRAVAARLAQDSEAAALLAELRNTRKAMAGSELVLKLPESREFFWPKIEREILRQPKPEPRLRPNPISALLRRFLVPSAAALAVLAVVLTLTFARRGGVASPQLAEIELLAPNMSASMFRDQSEQMTMVWLYDRADSQVTVEPTSGTLNSQ